MPDTAGNQALQLPVGLFVVFGSGITSGQH
jgi:hypothetical protein